MRKLCALLVLVMPLFFFLEPAPGQESAGGMIFTRHRQFRIPFNPGPAENRIKQLQLFVSVDQGRTWQPSGTAHPEKRHFSFTAERDGYHWFAVQTLDIDNKLFPLSLEGVAPSMKVVIDTQPPTVMLQPLPARGNEVGVSWDIRDENLDLSQADATRLEYRLAGNPAWIAVGTAPGANQVYWAPQSTGPIEVRLRAKDRAGNFGEGTLTLGAGGQGAGGQGGAVQPRMQAENPTERPTEIFNAPSDSERTLVGSKRISLNLELKDVGPSGVSLIELWYTQDGRSWNKYPARFGEDQNQRNIAFDVAAEGLYGITLVAKSGVGLGERAPQIGDRPQLWIEVDVTKPAVQIQNILVGAGPEKGKLNISWSARDRNLSREPITLSYAEQVAGPWTPIAEKLANSGRYIWTMPQQIPYQFHLKVEAIDRAGNVGEAVTDSLIKVDLSQPKVRILNVEPAGK